MKIALAGNPNSGKTTLFNAITGKIEHVGNWAGVTVDKKEGIIKKQLNPQSEKIIVVDLPGAYSIAPYTSEESITKDFIKTENPDVIINVVDSTNLNRNLFFTTQLLELGIPTVIALNKNDLCNKKGNQIDESVLGKILHCPVIKVASVDGVNNELKQLIREAVQLRNKKKKQVAPKIVTQKTAEDSEDRGRYYFVNELVQKVEKRNNDSSQLTVQDKVDRIVAHRIYGIPVFIGVIWLVFQVSQSWLGPWLADTFVGWIDGIYDVVEGVLGQNANPVLSNLLLEGMIGGVGAVVGFLPLIMVLFFLLALLEDCGYMARVAVVMDKYFKKIGLSGRSVIPMIVGTGCSIPGIMATRTIKNDRQRRTTAMLTPFMPCGAKLPVIALFAGVFFADNAWVGTSMYFLGIFVIMGAALVIRKITGDNSRSYFIMELPEYRFPSIKRATISMFSRAKAFIVKAGTVILVCNAAIQLLQTFSWQFKVVAETAPETSILATIASPVAILLIPLGFGAWQFAAAAISGFIAKENVVGTLAVCFSITNFINTEELSLVGGANEVAATMGIGSVAALAYLVFNLFTPPCFAAIGAMKSEIESSKWFWGAVAFQFGTGYTLAFWFYQIGTLITTGEVGEAFLPGFVAVMCMASIVVYYVTKGTKCNTTKGIAEAV